MARPKKSSLPRGLKARIGEYGTFITSSQLHGAKAGVLSLPSPALHPSFKQYPESGTSQSSRLTAILLWQQNNRQAAAAEKSA